MAKIKAFPALRFTPAAGKIAANVCPPYDIISPEERAAYIADPEKKNNIIRLELPTGDHAYEDAGALYRKMREDGILACDKTPGIYIYEEDFTVGGCRKTIRGIFARVKLYEFSENVILPHEETLSKAKTDRFNLMCATDCNFSPIYSMYSDADGTVSKKLDAICEKTAPDVSFTLGDGITHRLRKIEAGPDTAFLEKALADKQLFIADGHHRYETALNFRRKLIADGVIPDDEHPANYVMMMLIDMENKGLVVFPTHRMIKGLSAFDAADALKKIKIYFDVKEITRNEIESALAENFEKKAFVYCTKDGAFHLLTLKDTPAVQEELCRLCAGKSAAYRGLDVTVLHALILEKLFGIDRENMAKQINLSYTRDLDEACGCVKKPEYQCAFILNPTKVSEIKDVALAGEKMPQKSTYFYPKLITGLVMNDLTQA